VTFTLPNIKLCAVLLHTLAGCRAPITIWTLIESADPFGDLCMTERSVYRELCLLQRYDIVVPTMMDAKEVAWSITDMGRTWLSENETALSSATGGPSHPASLPNMPGIVEPDETMSFPDRMTHSAAFWLLTAFAMGALIGSTLVETLRSVR
jgi:hypothetical protein